VKILGTWNCHGHEMSETVRHERLKLSCKIRPFRNSRSKSTVWRCEHYLINWQNIFTVIGVNAAGVAGVATPNSLVDLQGSSCVDDPPIFWQVFYFFPSAELLNKLTASRYHFHLQCAQCTVFASLYRSLGTNWYFYKVYRSTTIHGTHES